MKLQYRICEYIGFRYVVMLYHDGELVKTYKVWLDKIEDEEASLRNLGYTYGYTKEEVEKARCRYLDMLKDII